MNCTHCGRPRRRRPGGGWRGAHGWCSICYERWAAAGKPSSGVPSLVPERVRVARITATAQAARAERIGEYVRLRRLGFTIGQAASDVGVSVRWARRHGYEMAYLDEVWPGRRAA